MTDKTNDPIQDDVEADVGGDQQTLESVEELKAQIAKANAEAAKHKSIAKKAIADRDAANAKTKTSQDEDYKTLYQTALDEKSKLHAHVKTGAVKAALTEQLTKIGVDPRFINDAVDLIDHNSVEWDIESGVDSTSITAAAQKFKGARPAFFEKQLKSADVKNAGQGSSGEQNTMTRAEYRALSPEVRTERNAKGWKLVD